MYYQIYIYKGIRIRKLWDTGRLINVSQVQKEIGACIGTDKARGVKVERIFKRRNG